MNRKQEILVNYREITITLERLDLEIERLSRTGFIGGPRELRSPQITGMPRGTNDPEAAILQKNDVEAEILASIQEKQAIQYDMMLEARRIVDSIQDPRLQNIVAYYYLHGWTDEAIAEKETLSQTHVNRLRTEFFNSLI
ncbi:MAG: hypothetical protein J6S83_06665 [Lachnospiraceae bacterium]|nr:hypothetical protein [Lachnospiraceae bacterium]